MQFNSFIFILIFLPITVTTYFLCNRKNFLLGKLVIILASALFYTYTNWKASIFLLLSLVLNYVFVLIIRRAKRFSKFFFSFPLFVNIIGLLIFKYTDFFILNINNLFNTDISLTNLILPVGISFFTFQQIAYLVSVHNNELTETSIIDYLAFILYFPKILMGPLMDPIDFITQLNDKKRKCVDLNNIAYGIKIFSLGLFKKVMLADLFDYLVTWGFSNVNTATSLDLILVSFFYTFEIYFDFCGYSDMAVGVSYLFNIELPINFDSPYKALSINDFWKRWHISLTKFFTKYIYIPMGGSRKGAFNTYRNILIIFLLSGLWHGANWTFILWGVIHGLLMIIDKMFDKFESKVFKPVRWLISFGIINTLWLLFRADSFSQWVEILKNIFSFNSLSISDGLIGSIPFPERELIKDVLHIRNFAESIRGFWLICFIIISLLICLIPENNYVSRKKLSVFSLIISFAAFVWGFVCLGNESIFVYLNF